MFITTFGHFYPRPPRGGRREWLLFRSRSALFLSTPSARRATRCGLQQLRWPTISIHALREEGDVQADSLRHPGAISIHALREEGDGGSLTMLDSLSNFYPRPPRGGRPSPGSAQRSSPFDFYPRPPRGGRPGRFRLPWCRCSISIHALREEGDSKNRDKISIFKQIVQHSARI